MDDKNFVAETLAHIRMVSFLLSVVISKLTARAIFHDKSKLEDPEYDIFKEYTPKLAGMTYGSEEYKACLAKMGEALQHHYANNRHHPEYYKSDIPEIAGIKCMTLIDLVEMFCDWKAATLRHKDGDIIQSIKKNQQRFGFSDDLAQIFKNTTFLLEDYGTIGDEKK